jgi:NAD(P)-dependent dehydrogenase (short-subunit alcohol dehydrogenase family)
MMVSEREVALIVGGGPGISASCARLFTQQDMRVAVAARDTDKPVLKALAKGHGVTLHQRGNHSPEIGE